MKTKILNPLLNDCINGQVAIVTGGGKGIGQAICVTLSGKGAIVIIADKDVKAADETAAMISDGQSCAIELDVASEESILKLYALVKERFGRLDILVNNAGIFKATPILEITTVEWDIIQAINLRGAFLMSREALRMMQTQHSGRIINIASLSAKTGGIAAGAHYSASKAGLVCFTKSLAMQAAPYDICVNGITPGFIETALTQAWGDEVNAKLTERIPLKKFGQPQDVAETVAFLASQRGRYITGEIIDVNGGLWMD
jgi:3-oxoacyl-[acyl-carrier protein] reductase